MIFNQFMEEEDDEAIAQKMQAELNGQANNTDNQNNDLSVRKADSEKFG